MVDGTVSGSSMESMVGEYISKELASDLGDLDLKSDTPLLDSHIIDSLSLLKLVLFLEQKFGVTVGQDELVPKNFSTIEAICKYIRLKKAK